MGRPKEVTDEALVATARRLFLQRGVGVSAAEIGREAGVSHTTLFNRFGSKDGLLLAALGPPAEVPWIRTLEGGPDERPIREQLVEHGQIIAAFFRELHAGLSMLRCAGVDPDRALHTCSGTSAPERAYAALVAWIERAQQAGRLADCDANTLSATILGALQGRATSQQVCGVQQAADEAAYVRQLVDLLWVGIGVDADGS
ncbi:MAG: TetR/AcrR family transcriptional regulator [Myxococcales bacterium]|nr:TetR/AcrR family transcriptional regulator [Myxococcales bacterium]